MKYIDNFVQFVKLKENTIVDIMRKTIIFESNKTNNWACVVTLIA